MNFKTGCLGLLLALWALSGPPAAASRMADPQATQLRAPLRFEPNRGQADARVRFLARGAGYGMFLTDDEVAMRFAQGDAGAGGSVLRLRLDGASPRRPRARLRQAGRSHYLPLADGGGVHTDLPHYAEVVQRGRYPGIDMVWYGTARDELEYDFVLAPGADPAQIVLRFDGADALRVDAHGNLLIGINGRTLLQRAPVAFQYSDQAAADATRLRHTQATRTPVAARYALGADGSVRFVLGSYQRSLPLVIDPVLAWSSYLGGNGDDAVLDVAARDGFVYAVGRTASTNFPTQNPLDGSHNGGFDCFVSKFATDGSGLVYSTYLGGPGTEYCNSVAVDADGEAYVVGAQASQGGDGFLVKLLAAGNAAGYPLVLAAGSGLDEAMAVAVTDSGVATVVGYTDSTNFPTTAGVAQTADGPGRGAFALRVTTAGAIQWSTYLDGVGEQRANAVAFDAAGNAYVAGQTFNREPAGDGFVIKLNPSGALIWNTARVDGNGFDSVHDVQVDDATGDTLIAGYTESSDLPTTPGVVQTAYAGQGDAFVGRITSAGNAFVWLSYLGGPRAQSANALRRDAAGNLYVVGRTDLVDPSGDVFLIKLGPQAANVHYNLQYGGAGMDSANGLAVAANGDAWVGGATASTDFPVTPGAFDTSKGAGEDGFVIKVGPELATQTLVTDATLAGTAVGSTGAATSPAITLQPGDLVTVEAAGGTVNFNTGGPCISQAFEVGPAGYRGGSPMSVGSACYSADVVYFPDPMPDPLGQGHAGLFRPQQAGIGPARFIGAGSETFTYSGAGAATLRLGVNDQPGTPNAGQFNVRVTIVRNGSFDVAVPANAVSGADVFAAQLRAGDQVLIDNPSGSVNFNTAPTCGAPGAYQVGPGGLARSVYEDPANVLCFTNDRSCADPLTGGADAHAGLIRRVGSSRSFVGLAGASFTATVNQGLWLGVNDCTGAGSIAPNAGGFSARVRVTRPVSILSVDSPSRVEGAGGALRFTVTLAPASAQTVQVRVRTADRSALAGSDYTALDQLLIFAPGETTKSVDVQVLGDAVIEADEVFSLELRNAMGASTAQPRGLGSIIDDDFPLVSVSGASCTEGNSGLLACSASVSLSAATAQAASVRLSTQSGSASAPSDFVAINGQIIEFAAGASGSQTVSVNIVGEHTIESNETFQLVLSDPAKLGLGTASATMTIINDDFAGTISVQAGTQSHAESAGTVALTITRSGGLGAGAGAGYTLVPGSAATPSDWSAPGGTSGSVVFAGGETSKSVLVNLVDDALDEGDETFSLVLAGPTGGAGLGNASSAQSILDNDPMPSLSVDNGGCAVTEGNSGSVDCNFTVRLSAPSGRQVTFNTATANASASAGSDFTGHASTARSIGAGQTSLVVAVPVLGDTLVEGNEQFALNLTGIVNATPGSLSATGSIIDDDSVSLSIADANVVEGDTGTRNATLTVNLSSASAQPVSVNWNTTNVGGPNVNGSFELPALPGPVTTYTAGQSIDGWVVGSGSVDLVHRNFWVPAYGNQSIDLNGDGPGELYQDLSLTPGQTYGISFQLSANPQCSPGPRILEVRWAGVLVGTYQVDSSSVSLPNIAFGVHQLNLVASAATARLSFRGTNAGGCGPVIDAVQVKLAGEATLSGDYDAASGTLEFAPGQTSRTLGVVLRGDYAIEPAERFFVDLSVPVNASIADGRAEVSIQNDDAAGTIAFQSASASAPENNGALGLTIVRSGGQAQDVGVVLTPVSASATAGSDFDATAQRIAFAGGQAAASAGVTLLDDVLDENDETFSAGLAGAFGGAAIGATSSATATIVDNDPTPTLSIDNGGCSVTEGNAGSVNCSFVARLSAISGRNVSFTTATANGTATAGSDYTAHSAITRTLAAGNQTLAVLVPVLGDTIDEPNETFALNFTGVTNATPGTLAGTGTIVDDDEPLTPGSLRVREAALMVGENSGSVQIVVERIGGSSGAASVQYATANGSAIAGLDYGAASGTLNWAAGDASAKTITLSILFDPAAEPQESFALNLSQASGATLGMPASSTITIVDGTQLVMQNGFE
jgi:choice-of-anchor C domain-containing protein